MSQKERPVSGSEGGNLVVYWTNTYVSTYIPDGYEVSNISSSESFKRIVFINQQDKESLIIYTKLSGANNPGVDTEDASEFETVSINGHKGTLMVKDSMVTIV